MASKTIHACGKLARNILDIVMESELPVNLYFHKSSANKLLEVDFFYNEDDELLIQWIENKAMAEYNKQMHIEEEEEQDDRESND